MNGAHTPAFSWLSRERLNLTNRNSPSRTTPFHVQVCPLLDRKLSEMWGHVDLGYKPFSHRMLALKTAQHYTQNIGIHNPKY